MVRKCNVLCLWSEIVMPDVERGRKPEETTTTPEATESETEENKVEEVKADELISAADLIGVPKNED